MKDRIDRENYEVFFLDYHEGNLGPDEKDELMSFLKANPELFDEFNDFEDLTLSAPELKYPDKTELFRTEVSIPEAQEWDYRCIAYMEGDLSAGETEKFEQELDADPHKARILQLYLSTRSAGDEALIFEGKESLKKKAFIIPAWAYRTVAAAAVVVLGWIIFNPLQGDRGESRIAEESPREVFYIDKISPPTRYERIASTEVRTDLLHSKPLSPVEDNRPVIETYTREAISFAALTPAPAGKVRLSGLDTPRASDLFAYRYIPDPSEDEYQTLLAFTGDFMRKRLLGQDPELVEKSRFSFWELADAGLEKLSDMFGTQADIDRQYSDSGELRSVSFESPLVAFNTPVKRRIAAQGD